jgi:hypothetical protein
MAYRDELEALRQRERILAAELDEVGTRIRELEAARAESVVDRLEVASPCSRRWEDMIGDERVRYCEGCSQNVYNVESLTRREVEKLVSGKGLPCMRLFRRADGTLVTSDCPAETRTKRRLLVAAGAVGGGLAVFGVTMSLATPTRSFGTVMVREVDAPRSMEPSPIEAALPNPEYPAADSQVTDQPETAERPQRAPR